MTFEIWTAYVVTVLAMMSTPGPSQLLMLSTSMTQGFRRSLATAAGDLTANALQMIAAGFGLAAIVLASQSLFIAIKVAGVLYLLWLGYQMIFRSASGDAGGDAPPEPLTTLWIRGFVTSAANPKAVVFFAALFPQFLDTTEPLFAQVATLTLTYIAMDGLFLLAYGLGSGWLAQRLSGGGARLVNRIGGGFIIAAAVMLGLKSFREYS